MHTFHKSLSIILCLLLAIVMLPDQVKAEQGGEAFAQLTDESHRQAYQIVEEGIAGMVPLITFPEDVEIFYRDLKDIIRAVCVDHPEYFWFLESGTYEYKTEFGGERVSSFAPDYYLDGQIISAGSQELADAVVLFRQTVNRIIAGIPINYTTEYEIALYLHDYLASHVTYSLQGDHESAYAALIHGEAACYGYSKAYQCLLNEAGIRAHIITGEALVSEGTLQGHAWNQVWIDDVCYYTDVTWDDLDDGIHHFYFLVSLEEFAHEHIPDSEFQLPPCGHALDYYTLSQGSGVATFHSGMDPKEAANYFALTKRIGSRAIFICELRFEGNGFVAWLNQNGAELVKALGLSNLTQISYYNFDDIYFVILSDTKFSPPDTPAEQIKLNLSEAILTGVGAQVQLDAKIYPGVAGLAGAVFESDNKAVATIDASGLVTAVGIGAAVITARSVDGLCSAMCTITVEEGLPHVHSLRHIPASDATCKLEGKLAYYHCNGCGRRYADELAQQELMDVKEYILPATSHLDTYWYGAAKNHVQKCKCGAEIPGTAAAHLDRDENNLCDTCGRNLLDKPVFNKNDIKQSGNSGSWKLYACIGGGLILAVIAVVFVVRRRKR